MINFLYQNTHASQHAGANCLFYYYLKFVPMIFVVHIIAVSDAADTALLDAVLDLDNRAESENI